MILQNTLLIGFYCPELSTCILPCHLGSYCRTYQYVFVPASLRRSSVQPLCKSMGLCCVDWHGEQVAPIELTLVNGSKIFKCQGMSHPHPCPKGNYCPSTTTRVTCTSGHFCPEGSIEPLQCPVSLVDSGYTLYPLLHLC